MSSITPKPPVPFVPVLATKVVEIGAWNMDTTVTHAVAHGLTASSIRSVTGYIVNDTGNAWDVLSQGDAITNIQDASIEQWNATNILLGRLVGGIYDNANYDVVANRGHLVILYEA